MPGMLRASTGVGSSSAPTVSLQPGRTAPASAAPSGGDCAGPPPKAQYARSCQTTINAQPACAVGAVPPAAGHGGENGCYERDTSHASVTPGKDREFSP